MVKKKKKKKKKKKTTVVIAKKEKDFTTKPPGNEIHPNDEMLTSQQDVADALGMSTNTLERYLKKYPFHNSGAPGKVNSRWRVLKSFVFKWWNYVQRQETRHPEARRLRPEEAPDLQDIKGRGDV